MPMDGYFNIFEVYWWQKTNFKDCHALSQPEQNGKIEGSLNWLFVLLILSDLKKCSIENGRFLNILGTEDQ